MAEKKPKAKKVSTAKKRTKLSQKDVPSMSLDKSLAVAKAIVDNYASKPASPLQVARALNVTPTSGPFRMLCGASVACGLTKGGYNVDKIELLPLGKRILKPTTENDDLRAKVEAFSRPRVINEFINKYNGSPIPRKDIAKNVLEEMGVAQAEAYFDAFFAGFNTIAERPFSFESVDYIKTGYRRCVCGVDSIYFKVSSNVVEIIAILGRQDITSIV